MSEVQAHAIRVANATRLGGDVQQARVDLLAAKIAKLVAAAPPLTEDQKAVIVATLGGAK